MVSNGPVTGHFYSRLSVTEHIGVMLSHMVEMDSDPISEWCVPDYSGACLSNLLPAVVYRLAQSGHRGSIPAPDRFRREVIRAGSTDPSDSSWLFSELDGLDQMVVFVVDGLGFSQLEAHLSDLEMLGSLKRITIDSVAPTTTASALTSITTGLPPSLHGLVGYRMRVGPRSVMNTLRWSTGGKKVSMDVNPYRIAPVEPFFGLHPAVVTKSGLEKSEFSLAHLRSSRNSSWRTQSGIGSWIKELLANGEKFIYAYYEGIDSTAHEFGLGDRYLEELIYLDFMIKRITEALPRGAGLLVTADHGQVEVLDDPLVIPDNVQSQVSFQSGEGRFRWLHLRSGSLEEAAKELEETFAGVCRVLTRQQVIEQEILGPKMSQEVSRRLGDVALIATSPVSFFDPDDTGPFKLVCRHGGLSTQEVKVPLLCAIG
jgi:hypothetical protein